MLINLSKEELGTVVGQLWKSRNTEEKVGRFMTNLNLYLTFAYAESKFSQITKCHMNVSVRTWICYN